MRKASVLLCASPIGLLATGSGTKMLDVENAQVEIRKRMARQAGTDVKSVKCPDPVEATKCDSFECTATGADSTTATIYVTQTDDEGRVQFDAPLLHTGPAERAIHNQLKDTSATRSR